MVQGSVSLQSLSGNEHAPLMHVSMVQRSLSAQVRASQGSTQFGLVPIMIHPNRASQASIVQVSRSSHTSGVPATQPIAGLHVSIPVHTLLSSQTVVVGKHPLTMSQPSSVQASASSQLVGKLEQPEDGSQSSIVQASESSQTTGVYSHPVIVLQISVVHSSASSQFKGR